MTLTAHTFARSPEQRMEALAKANRIRLQRVELKREVKANWQAAARALSSADPDLDTMRVYDLLMAVQGFGCTRVTRLLTVAGVSVRKTLGGLTSRQRSALLLGLARTKNGGVPRS